jgi:hypothetical protein
MRQLTGERDQRSLAILSHLDPIGSSPPAILHRARPAWLALAGHAGWAVVMYLLAWFSLKRRERKRLRKGEGRKAKGQAAVALASEVPLIA